MISVILIAMVVSLGLLETWYGVFFHGPSPMYVCDCGAVNKRGGNCTDCENARAAKRRAKMGYNRHDTDVAGPHGALLSKGSLNSVQGYWGTPVKPAEHPCPKCGMPTRDLDDPNRICQNCMDWGTAQTWKLKGGPKVPSRAEVLEHLSLYKPVWVECPDCRISSLRYADKPCANCSHKSDVVD